MNNPPKTTCALCLEGRPLLKSHILPKFVYRLIRTEEHTDPIIVQRGRAFLSSKEEREPLLCSECEGRFHWGENYIAPLLQKAANGRTRLQSETKLISDHGEKQVRSLGSLDMPRIKYFALSILWRSSVSTLVPQCCLGERYSESLRGYLFNRDQSLLPTNLGISIKYFEDDQGRVVPASGTPTSKREGKHHRHTFCTGGLEFRMLMGAAELPPQWRRDSLQGGYILCTRNLSDAYGISGLAKAKIVGKLAGRVNADFPQRPSPPTEEGA